MYNWCHGPNCHTYHTVDRIRGNKGNKVLRTRKIREHSWNKNSFYRMFCSNNCYNEFANKYVNQIVAIAPRTEALETSIEVTKVKHEGQEYGWGRTRDWTETKIKEVDNTSTNDVG